ncbi:MAG: sensor histidine kinase [Eggerthellaceae bacterium]|jgi:signal transduction histidine kinase
MNLFYGLGDIEIVIAGVIYLCLVVIQVAHTFLLRMRQGRGWASARVIYEALIVVHLVLPSLIAFGVHPFVIGSLAIQMHELLWLNGAIAAYAIFAFVKKPSATIVADFVLLVCSVPSSVAFLSNPIIPIIIIDAIYFLCRDVNMFVHDINYTKTHMTQLSIVELIKKFPEGILCADMHGNVLLLNDSMRYYLNKLELPTDLSDANEVKKILLANGTPLQENPVDLPSKNVSIELPDGTYGLFVLDETTLRHIKCLRVIAYDITEEAQLAKKIKAANKKLNKAGTDIAKSIYALNTVAETQAMLRMRSRVHDVIGQRLSMMHRLLEEDNVSNESIQKMRPLLNGILDDLRPPTDPNPAIELASLKSALTTIGVELVVEGKLPNDKKVAAAIAAIIRESATNAVRHAQALLVKATIESSTLKDGKTNVVELTIQNDGAPSPSSIIEGSGIAGMRHTAKMARGNLTIITRPRYRVCARFEQVNQKN